MKDIKSALRKIENEEKIAEKIAIFVKTKRGKAFVSKLHTASIKELQHNLQAPKFVSIYNNDTKNKNLILAVAKKQGITAPKVQIIHIEVPERVKCPVFLTKKEIGKIDARRPKKTLGFAARMHAIEEAKMAKFKALHKAPEEWQLRQDLFPQEMIDGYNKLVEAHREYVRNFIVSAYYKLSVIGRYKIADGVFVNKLVAKIKDIDGGGHHINGISKEHPLLKKVQAMADECYAQDNSLICLRIMGHTKLGRIIIPHKNIMLSKASAALQVTKYRKSALFLLKGEIRWETNICSALKQRIGPIIDIIV